MVLRIRIAIGVLAALASLATPAQERDGAQDAPKPDAPGGITEIILERTWCFGACPVDKLVLRADGTAEYTGMENVKQKGQFAGRFWSGDFEQLARWLVTEGFFGLADSYGRPNGDTPTQVIRVTRGGERKSVINNSIERSSQVWGMETVIRGVAADILWQPVRSGIRGQTMWKPPGEDWRPRSDDTLSIIPQKQGFIPSGTRQQFMVRTDQEGRFEISLPPGIYGFTSLLWGKVTSTVVVEPDKFVDASVRFEPASSDAPKPANLPPPPPPGDGIYLVARSGTTAKWLFNHGAQNIQLGDRADPVILAKRLISTNVDNTSFELDMAIPHDATVNVNTRVLIVGDTAYLQPGGGSDELDFEIPGEESAREVARHFGIPVGYFTKPDHQMRVTITPKQPSFMRGEAVSATLRIVNIGTSTIEFRGALAGNRKENDEYNFSASRNGQPVPDISFARDRGGTAIPKAVMPGATFEDTINLSKWFEFKEAGAYSVHGSYKLTFRDSRRELFAETRNLWVPWVEWTDNAEADFVVTIE